MKLIESVPDEFRSPGWNVALLLIAGSTYAALFLAGMSLELVLLGLVAALACGFVLTRSTFNALLILICVSLFLNVANYTFLSFTSEGQRAVQGTESRFLVLLRLPLVMLGTAIALWRYGGRFTRFLYRNADVALFCAVPFVAILYSPEKISSLQYATWFLFSTLAVLSVCYAIALASRSIIRIDSIAWILVIGYLPTMVLVYFTLASYGGGSLKSAYSNSNFYAYGCCTLLAALLVLERHRNLPGRSFVKRIPAWLIIAAIAMNAVPLVLSAKRAAIGAGLLSLLAYALSSRSSTVHGKGRAMLRGALVVGVIGMVAWSLVPRAGTTLDRFERLADPTQEDYSFESRLNVWRTSISVVVEEFPLFGVGLANGKTATGRLAATEEGAGHGLHSTPVGVFVETGAVGSLLFLIVVLRSFTLWRTRWPRFSKWNLAILGAAPIVMSMTEYNLLPGQALFWPLWMAILLPRVSLGMQENGPPRIDA